MIWTRTGMLTENLIGGTFDPVTKTQKGPASKTYFHNQEEDPNHPLPLVGSAERTELESMIKTDQDILPGSIILVFDESIHKTPSWNASVNLTTWGYRCHRC
jgi:hypothetical protein